MANFNQCTFAGNLTRDVELKYTKDNVAIAESAIAVNWKSSKNREEVMFLDLTVWRDQAETFAKYLSKGSSVLVTGRLQLQQWENEDGTKRSRHALIVNSFQFLDGKRDDATQRDTHDTTRDSADPAAAVAAATASPSVPGDDVPF